MRKTEITIWIFLLAASALLIIKSYRTINQSQPITETPQLNSFSATSIPLPGSWQPGNSTSTPLPNPSNTIPNSDYVQLTWSQISRGQNPPTCYKLMDGKIYCK